MQTPPKWKALGLPILAYDVVRRHYVVAMRDYQEAGAILQIASGSASAYLQVSSGFTENLARFIDSGTPLEGTFFRQKASSDPESGDIIFSSEEGAPFLECVYMPWQKYQEFCNANQVCVELGYAGNSVRLPGQEGHSGGSYDVREEGQLPALNGVLRGLLVPIRARRVSRENFQGIRSLLNSFGIAARVNGSGSWSLRRAGDTDSQTLLLKGADWEELVVRMPDLWTAEVPF